MNRNDLKKMTNADLKNLIKKYKKSNCPPYSTLKKSDLIDLIIKLKIKPETTRPVQTQPKSPVRSAPVRSAPPRSPVREDDSGIVDKTKKEKLLKKVAKMISKTKKELDETPDIGGPRMSKSSKQIELEEKLDNLLTIQKYLNTIYRDNIKEKVSRKKIEALLE